jgi:hypothetical protein
MLRDGADIFVANSVDGSLTEIDASTGSLVKVISASRYEFDAPSSVVGVGDELFVANSLGDSVTELPAG